MHIARTVPVVTTALVLAAGALAQDVEVSERSAPAPPVPAESPDAKFIPLYGDKDDESSEQWETFFGQLIVRNVSSPSIYPVLPQPENRNGRAVLILPGGGYQFISMQNEGFPVAQRLADSGYAAFILKYRTRETARAPAEFLNDASKSFRGLGTTRLPAFRPAADDLFAAAAHIRERCPDYHCDGRALSVIGFSAGARAVIMGLEDRENEIGVAHVALVYPPMLDPIVAKPDAPLFLVAAQDDPLFMQGGFTLADAWIRKGGSIEFHLYNSGGHGFGTVPTGKTSQGWLDAYVSWLGEQGDQDVRVSAR